MLCKAAFVALHVHIRRDIIGAKGHPGMQDQAGELSVFDAADMCRLKAMHLFKDYQMQRFERKDIRI